MQKKITLQRISIIAWAFLLFAVKANAQCLNDPNGQWPSGTFTPTSTSCDGITVQNIATNCYNGEYSKVSVTSGQTYTFTSSVATDYITISDNGGTTALAFGTTPVTWVATSSQTVRFYTHADGVTCGASSVNRTRAVRCGIPPANDAAVTNVYTLGKIPVTFGAGHIVQARVANYGTNTLTNLNVTLNITGANTFTDVQVIASLAPNAVQIVNFLPFSPTTLGNNTVAVTVPSDNVNTNNSQTWTQQVTQNLTTYKNPSLPNDGGVGFNTATGDFVAKFNTATAAQINEVKVDFYAGGQPYTISIWDATGTGGTPGSIIWTSSSLTSATGTAFIPVPNVAVTGDYFVGVNQTAAANVNFAFQYEDPLIRPNTFYYASPGGSTTWTDFSSTGTTNFRFAIEPQYFLPQPPNCAASYLPVDKDTLVDPNTANLTWASGGGGATDYDVYFGTTYPPPFIGNQTGTSFPVVLSPGTTYYWHVVAKNTYGAAVGCDTLEFKTYSAPANDDCAGAIALTVNGDLNCGTVTAGTIIGATASTGVPTSSCGTFDDDVWYTFVATQATHVINIAHVSGSTSDYSMQIIDGSSGCGNTTALLCSDPTTNVVVANLVPSTTYYLRVASYSSTAGQTSIFNVCVGTPPPPPVNDACANAITVPVNATCGTPTTATTVGATMDMPNPSASCWSSSNDDDVWYTFTTPATATEVTINISNYNASSTAATLGYDLFTGSCGATTAMPGVCNITTSSTTNGTGSYKFTGLTPNTTYLIRLLTSGSGYSATFDFCLTYALCQAPNSLAYSNVSAASADVTWTSTGGSELLEYGPIGYTPGTGATAGTGGTLVSPATSPTTIPFTSTSGYDVYIRQDCSGAGNGFSQNEKITVLPPPLNDECTGAIVIASQTSTGSYTQSTSNINATQSMSPVTCETYTSTAANDVWYSVTPATSGNLDFDVDNNQSGNMDAVLEVFTGACGSLTSIACVDENWPLTVPVTANTTYYVRVYGYGGQQTAFDLGVTGAPLAIRLDKITAANVGAANRIDWNSLTEERGDKFELQRSIDGKNFTAIYQQKANGEPSRYTYMDNNAVKGMNFYRLRMIAANGNVTYSETVTASVKAAGFEVEAFPNPVSHDLTVKVSGIQGADATIQVTDVTGKVIRTVKMTASVETINMNGLANGIYLIKYSDASHTQTIKVNKQ